MHKTIAGEAGLALLPSEYLNKQLPQCGECLVAQLLNVFEVIKTYPDPSQLQIIAATEQVYCRCTAYNPLKAAVARTVILRGVINNANA